MTPLPPARLLPALLLPALLLPAAVLLAGCEPDEPVLAGIPDEPILTPAAAPDNGADSPAAPSRKAGPRPYEKAANVHIDVLHLGGRSYDASRGLLAEQLGVLTASIDLPGDDGKEVVYQHGTIRVVDDRVYMIRVPLPSPLRRTDALVALGFPPQADRYLVLHREYRLNHQWGFRRIRMKRQSRQSELVTEIEAWKWVPGEHTNRR